MKHDKSECKMRLIILVDMIIKEENSFNRKRLGIQLFDEIKHIKLIK